MLKGNSGQFLGPPRIPRILRREEHSLSTGCLKKSDEVRKKSDWLVRYTSHRKNYDRVKSEKLGGQGHVSNIDITRSPSDPVANPGFLGRCGLGTVLLEPPVLERFRIVLLLGL